MSTSWHRLLAETAVIRRTPVSNSDSVMSYVSGFQIPDAFRQVDDSRYYIVELQYLDEGEGTKEITMADGTIVSIGRQSGRVFAVHLPKSLIHDAIRARLAKGTVAANAVQALQALPTPRGSRPGHLDNYRVTESLLREHTPMFERQH